MEKVYIRNTIGWSITNTEFSHKFQNAIKKEKDNGNDTPHVAIHINSPGGSVYMGWDMFNEIRHAISEGVHVDAYNNGLAASIASVLLLAANKENRYVAENSLGMIHEPSGIAFGDKEKMRKEADILEKINDLMSSYYSKTTGKDIGYMKYLMKETTWFKPSEMIEAGFIKEGNIVDGGKPIKNVQAIGLDKAAFGKIPSDFEKVINFSESVNHEDEQFSGKLTKTNNSQIREKAWKNYMNYLV